MSDDQDHHNDEAFVSSDSDAANDSTAVDAVDVSEEQEPKKPAGALKFLSIIMLLLAIGVIVLPFVWGLKDTKTYAPDSSVLNPWMTWLGDLHLLVLHIPVGIFVYVLLMEIVGLLTFRKFKPHLGAALAVTSIFAVVAVVFGYFLFLQGDNGPAKLEWDLENNAMGMHLWFSIAFAVFVIFAFLRKMWSRHHHKFSLLYPIFMLLAAASLAIGAHFGGQLVHSDKDILADGKILFNGGDPAKERKVAAMADPTEKPAEERLVWAEIIKPILHQKCWECHAEADLNPLGEDKIKGGLDMTTVDDLKAGGDDGDIFPTLTPGDVENSELVGRAKLDPDDDEFMPKGKEDEPEFQLTDGEIKILEWWIDNGGEEKGMIEAKNDIPLKEATDYESILPQVQEWTMVRPLAVAEEPQAEEPQAEEEAAEPDTAEEMPIIPAVPTEQEPEETTDEEEPEVIEIAPIVPEVNESAETNQLMDPMSNVAPEEVEPAEDAEKEEAPEAEEGFVPEEASEEQETPEIEEVPEVEEAPKTEEVQTAQAEPAGESAALVSARELFPNAFSGSGTPGSKLTFRASRVDGDFGNADLVKLELIGDELLELDLRGSEITDEAAKSIAQMTGLRHLLLNSTQAGNEIAATLGKLPNLEMLSLYGTQVSNEGLSALEESESLRLVYLTDSKVDAEGVEKLQNGLPAADVIFQASDTAEETQTEEAASKSDPAEAVAEEAVAETLKVEEAPQSEEPASEEMPAGVLTSEEAPEAEAESNEVQRAREAIEKLREAEESE